MILPCFSGRFLSVYLPNALDTARKKCKNINYEKRNRQPKKRLLDSTMGISSQIAPGFTDSIKSDEHYFPVVLFITLYKVVLTIESVEVILTCGHSN